MIRVTIDLHSAVTGKISRLGVLEISNVTVGPIQDYENYELELTETSYGGVKTLRRGSRLRWRRARGAICLVRDAIAALFE
jgi:hypothetical protein